MDGLVAAVQARIQGMPFGTTSGAVVKDGVAQIKVAYPTELVASGQGRHCGQDHGQPETAHQAAATSTRQS